MLRRGIDPPPESTNNDESNTAGRGEGVASLIKRLEEVPFEGPPPVSHTWKARPRELNMTFRRNKEHAEESAEVEVLLAQARKHDELGRKIKASMARITDIGSSLQAAVGPVYNDTQYLQTTTQNADRMLQAINKMQTPLEGKADEEKIVREGPERVGLPNYLACLRRIEGRYDQLNRSNVRVNQDAAREMSQLLTFGAKRIQELFEDTLKSVSEKVEPLQFITRNRPFPVFEQGTIAKLAELQTFLASAQRNNIATQVYADIRGRYLQTSLSNLSSATLTTARRQNTEEIYRQGTCAIGTYATGVEISFAAEWKNICSVFGASDRGRLLENTTSKALSEFAKTLRDLNTQVKQNVTADCFLAYDTIGVVNTLAFEIEKKTGLLKQEIFGAVKPVRDTAKMSLSQLLDDIHRSVSATMVLPMDGAAIPYTAQVMTRLQSMTAYPAPLGSIMSSVGDGNWNSSAATNNSSSSIPTLKSFDVNPNGSSLLAHYVEDTIETLLKDLDAKSRACHKQRNITGVFLLNNLAVCERMIRSSDLAPLLPKSDPPNTSKLDAWRERSVKSSLEPWSVLASTSLMDQTIIANQARKGQRPPSGNAGTVDSAAIVKNLGSKDKDAIKKKLENFNAQFDILCAKHRELTPAMEKEARQLTARSIADIIGPMYRRFYEKYHEIDKGKGKYIRFDPAGLSGQLAGLA